MATTTGTAAESANLVYTITMEPPAQRAFEAAWSVTHDADPKLGTSDNDLSLISGTAHWAGSDVVATAEASKVFTITIGAVGVDTSVGDSLYENTEKFTIAIGATKQIVNSVAQNRGTVGGTAQTGTVTNSGPAPTFTWQSASQTFAEGTTSIYRVNMSPKAEMDWTVVYTVTVDTAETNDFDTSIHPVTGTLTIAGDPSLGSAGDHATFTLEANADNFYEVSETFDLALSLGTEAEGSSTGTFSDTSGGVITNVGAIPKFEYSALDLSGNEGTSITYTITMSPAAEMAWSLEWAASVVTAEANDFGDGTTGVPSGTLTFAGGITGGDSSKDIVIATNADTWHETDETFSVTLSDPKEAGVSSSASNAVLGLPNGPVTGGTIVDMQNSE